MKEGKIVLRLLFPAQQDAAKAVQPVVTSFQHPAPCSLACLLCKLFGLFSLSTNVGSEAKLGQDRTQLLIALVFVQTDPLGLRFAWGWSIDDDTLRLSPYQLHLMAIGSINDQAYRNP